MGKVLGISGKKGSGKDTLGDAVSQYYREGGGNAIKLPLAGPLKSIAQGMFRAYEEGTLLAYLGGQEIFEGRPGLITTAIGLTGEILTANPNADAFGHSDQGVRKLLQWLGTEVGRTYRKTYWTDQCRLEILAALPVTDLVVVPDIRFETEAEMVSDLPGVLVRLDITPELQAQRLQDRDGFSPPEELLNHASERGLDDYGFQYRINSADPLEASASYVIDLLS